jgi:hypothetical protein
MTKLVWDQAADRRYEAGLDRGVFYPRSGPGEVWNGLTSVQESPSDADERTRYLDGVRTRTRRKPGDFSGTIEAFTYPESFQTLLDQRKPRGFDLSYRVKTADSYKIHLVYNILVSPTTHMYEQEDTIPFSWDFTTTPAPFPQARPTAHFVIEASDAYSWTLEALENVLYGDESTPPTMPSPLGILDIFEENSILQIIDHGDGTWTAIGPDDVVSMLDATTFQIDWPSAVYIDATSYTVRSL